MSELVWGIKNGDLDQVKDIVEKSAIDVNKEIEGRNPIHYAADYGQYDVINYLISKGADVNAKDKHGISALLAAIWEGHTSCVRLLIEKGAEKCGQTPDGSSYLDVAEKDEIKDLLLFDGHDKGLTSKKHHQGALNVLDQSAPLVKKMSAANAEKI